MSSNDTGGTERPRLRILWRETKLRVLECVDRLRSERGQPPWPIYTRFGQWPEAEDGHRRAVEDLPVFDAIHVGDGDDARADLDDASVSPDVLVRTRGIEVHDLTVRCSRTRK